MLRKLRTRRLYDSEKKQQRTTSNCAVIA